MEIYESMAESRERDAKASTLAVRGAPIGGAAVAVFGESAKSSDPDGDAVSPHTLTGRAHPYVQQSKRYPVVAPPRVGQRSRVVE
jgi:hypothetical protein